MIDSHAHVADEAFDGDRDEVLRRAAAGGLTGIVCIGQDAATSRRALALANRGFLGLDLAATAGLHPHEAKSAAGEIPQIQEMAALEGVAAIGETGLDFHYNYSPAEDQRRSFRWHLETARALGKPAVVHVREAHREALEDLRAHPGVRFIVHCFTGNDEEARRYLDLGGYVSFSGILTFPKAEPIRAAARIVPADRLLVETDSPFLAPEPHRGKRCEPAFVGKTVERLAALRSEPAERVASATAENAKNLFFASRGANGGRAGAGPAPVPSFS